MPIDISLNENHELDDKSKLMVTSSEAMPCLRENIHTGEMYIINDDLMEGEFSMENVVTFFMSIFNVLGSMTIIPRVRQLYFGSKIYVRTVDSNNIVIKLNLFFLFP